MRCARRHCLPPRFGCCEDGCCRDRGVDKRHCSRPGLPSPTCVSTLRCASCEFLSSYKCDSGALGCWCVRVFAISVRSRGNREQGSANSTEGRRISRRRCLRPVALPKNIVLTMSSMLVLTVDDFVKMQTAMDKDGDGQVNKVRAKVSFGGATVASLSVSLVRAQEEFKEAYKLVYNGKPTEFEATYDKEWAKIDTDGDGNLTLKELVSFYGFKFNEDGSMGDTTEMTDDQILQALAVRHRARACCSLDPNARFRKRSPLRPSRARVYGYAHAFVLVLCPAPSPPARPLYVCLCRRWRRSWKRRRPAVRRRQRRTPGRRRSWRRRRTRRSRW